MPTEFGEREGNRSTDCRADEELLDELSLRDLATGIVPVSETEHTPLYLAECHVLELSVYR